MSPLAQYIKDRKMKQSDFAMGIGVSRSTIGHVCTGIEPVRGVLRDHLQDVAPEVLAAQDAFYLERKARLELEVRAA